MANLKDSNTSPRKTLQADHYFGMLKEVQHSKHTIRLRKKTIAVDGWEYAAA